MEIYSLGQQIARLALRVAIVEVHDASDADADFLENVAANRGGALEFFDDLQEAKDWLQVD